jgi:hypothetical protein
MLLLACCDKLVTEERDCCTQPRSTSYTILVGFQKRLTAVFHDDESWMLSLKFRDIDDIANIMKTTTNAEFGGNVSGNTGFNVTGSVGSTTICSGEYS